MCFLIGALAMTFGCGLLFLTIFDSATDASDSHALSASVDIALGGLLIAASEAVRRRPPRVSSDGVSGNRWIARLMRSPGLSVLLGAAMYAPSPLYLGALKIVSDSGLSAARELLWIIGMTVIVVSMIEIPVVLMVREPERGRAVLREVNEWMTRNGRAVSRWMLLVAGLYLVVRGVIRI